MPYNINMVDIQNYDWEQGEDGLVSMVYSVKATPTSELLPVDLTGYSLRMDIATDGTNTRMWTFNSDDIVATPSVDFTGVADNEAILGSNGLISVLVPRSLTLPAGAIYEEIQAGNLVFNYDVFLRSASNKQKKILKGKITINKSVTLWL